MKERLKRLIDLIAVAAAAPVAGPILGVFGLWIKREDPGPILFKQTRVGRDGQPFTLYKLRTMVMDAESKGAGLYFVENDPRILKSGHVARRFSLDELPQLINIFKGEMSFIGPRPMLEVTTREHAEEYEVILEVKPGLTGLTQVSGRNSLTRRRRLEFDMQYAKTWSVLGDIGILFRTAHVVLSGDGQLNNQSKDDVEK